jgi:NADPH:quinone reductase-like Zn-dependent oxidoreductase
VACLNWPLASGSFLKTLTTLLRQHKFYLHIMKAAIRTQYGTPDVLSVKTVETPRPKQHEILVRVRAATVNRTDCGILSGKPWLIRCFTGLNRPKSPTPGTDFAGEIEAVGKKVTAFKVGDRVWGFNDNGLASHAQYLTLPESEAILKVPAHISYEQAAASAEGAHYALNFINKVKLAPGQKVLVYGASGAIGSAAVQILKSMDAYVVAVCDTKNMALIASIGPDKVVDYTQEDFTKMETRFDFVFDAVGKSSFGKCKTLLLPGGIYISSELGPNAENLYLPLVTKILGGKKVIFPLPANIKRSLAFMQNLLENEQFKPLIDRRYPIEDIREAYRFVASGQKTGNVMLTFD